MMIKKILVSMACVVLGVGLFATQASADHPSAPAVTLTGSSTNFTASGSIAAAHNALGSDTISCYVTGYGNVPDDDYEGGCTAVRSDGATRSCNFFNTAANVIHFVKAIGTINSASFIQFKGSDGGPCTEITVDNNSKYIIKSTTLKNGVPDTYVDISGFDGAGAIGDARDSFGDSTQYIGCDVVTDTLNGTQKSAFCAAIDVNSESASCSTTVPHVVELISMIKPDSYVEFDQDCARVKVVYSSDWRPVF